MAERECRARARHAAARAGRDTSLPLRTDSQFLAACQIHRQSGRFPGRMNALCRGCEKGRLRPQAQPSTRPPALPLRLVPIRPVSGLPELTPKRAKPGHAFPLAQWRPFPAGPWLASRHSDYRCGCSAGLVESPRTCFPFHSRRKTRPGTPVIGANLTLSGQAPPRRRAVAVSAESARRAGSRMPRHKAD